MSRRDLDMSRRCLFRAVGAAPFAQAIPQAANAEPVSLATQWFEIGGEITQLHYTWRQLDEIGWDHPSLSKTMEERRFDPFHVRFLEREKELECIQDRQQAMLVRLVDMPAGDLSGVLAKLSVVLGVMMPDDYPHCYDLIEDAVKTLASLTCPHCQRTLAINQAAALVVQAGQTWDELHNQV